MGESPTEIAGRYFEAWRAKDMDAYRALLADGADFAGPMGQAHGVDECVAGMRGLASMTTDVVVHKMLSDDNDVITWFELHTADAAPCPVANWTHVEDGKITQIRVTFDPRPLLPPLQ
ncbi:MAG: nuclear transport factor 2 family protein [Nocardioidaceae bacterium]